MFFALSGIAAVMVVGTIGFHQIAGMDWVSAVYFESMLATGQGPPTTLSTDAAKVFASVLSFASVSSVMAVLVVTLAPLISQVWREGLEKAEREKKGFERDAKRLGKDLSEKVKPEE